MKHTMKKLLAALVACMLLLSSVAALADGAGEGAARQGSQDQRA